MMPMLVYLYMFLVFIVLTLRVKGVKEGKTVTLPIMPENVDTKALHNLAFY